MRGLIILISASKDCSRSPARKQQQFRGITLAPSTDKGLEKDPPTQQHALLPTLPLTKLPWLVFACKIYSVHFKSQATKACKQSINAITRVTANSKQISSGTLWLCLERSQSAGPPPLLGMALLSLLEKSHLTWRTVDG